MARNENSSTQPDHESSASEVYMPGMPSLSVVETVAPKLFGRRGPLEPASEDE